MSISSFSLYSRSASSIGLYCFSLHILSTSFLRSFVDRSLFIRYRFAWSKLLRFALSKCFILQHISFSPNSYFVWDTTEIYLRSQRSTDQNGWIRTKYGQWKILTRLTMNICYGQQRSQFCRNWSLQLEFVYWWLSTRLLRLSNLSAKANSIQPPPAFLKHFYCFANKYGLKSRGENINAMSMPLIVELNKCKQHQII